MNGNYYANCFIHFEPYGPKEGELRYDRTSNLPPYIIPGSVWESEWRDENPDGWHQVRCCRFAGFSGLISR